MAKIPTFRILSAVIYLLKSDIVNLHDLCTHVQDNLSNNVPGAHSIGLHMPVGSWIKYQARPLDEPLNGHFCTEKVSST